MDKYDKIRHLSRPQYEDLPPMSVHDRAAQFSPFAALTGYDAAVAETARTVDSKLELTEDQENELNQKLSRLLEHLGDRPEIRLTYFVPDKHKDGGKYIDKTGVVRIYDSYARRLVFTDGERINVDDLYSLEFTGEEG